MSMRETLVRWNMVRNDIGADPVWVSVRFQFIDPEAGVVATIDWNNREAVRSFAAYSDACLRSGVRVTTQRVRTDGTPWAALPELNPVLERTQASVILGETKEKK